MLFPKDLKEKDPLEIKTITPKQHFTQPPPRYTEATLVKDLEKEGIGRPSTYATILKTIQARAYTELDDKKRFVPTELGCRGYKDAHRKFSKNYGSRFYCKHGRKS